MQAGTFVPPTIIDIGSIKELGREVFGPVLHVLRYRRDQLPALVKEINETGYGLTFGVHTRIDETIEQVLSQIHAGNLYVNRNIVGAVVGVQPFGGEGLSGTGPKAGGPLYLKRLLAVRPVVQVPRNPEAQAALQALADWLPDASQAAQVDTALLQAHVGRLLAAQTGEVEQLMPGPTGERNSYSLLPRERVLCLAQEKADLLAQLAACLAVGSQVLLPDDAQTRALLSSLPTEARDPIALGLQH